jgi:hypothetical protein
VNTLGGCDEQGMQNTSEGKELHTNFWPKYLKVRYHLADLHKDGRKILKWMGGIQCEDVD